MEITLLNGEIYELTEVKEETLYRVKCAVEWYFENGHDIYDFERICKEVDEEMAKEEWIYDATELFDNEVIEEYDKAIDECEKLEWEWQLEKDEQKRDLWDK